ncbi:hypothetical protein HYH02_003199 [Chlamydomonas schloesseri]|uniref:Uncharacterized protein n=1 Tax=Chlamydomonas schloesseri TaxID=2026947 RepID=A0A836B9X9_9CHLO|nr:hypothetical protein HYH02_003199 [Chlamydomonas schloesseri]|eukprot:KAG2452167.1 hypothetical protein HYH02_003199 [Chlamydomonas schloesseri]
MSAEKTVLSTLHQQTLQQVQLSRDMQAHIHGLLDTPVRATSQPRSDATRINSARRRQSTASRGGNLCVGIPLCSGVTGPSPPAAPYRPTNPEGNYVLSDSDVSGPCGGSPEAPAAASPAIIAIPFRRPSLPPFSVAAAPAAAAAAAAAGRSAGSFSVNKDGGGAGGVGASSSGGAAAAAAAPAAAACALTSTSQLDPWMFTPSYFSNPAVLASLAAAAPPQAVPPVPPMTTLTTTAAAPPLPSASGVSAVQQPCSSLATSATAGPAPPPPHIQQMHGGGWEPAAVPEPVLDPICKAGRLLELDCGDVLDFEPDSWDAMFQDLELMS